jgi:alpha-amylase
MLSNCKDKPKSEDIKAHVEEPTVDNVPFDWKGANVYFLLTDRFNNGDTSNDINFERTKETAVLRGFEGGDIKGVTQKVKEG